MNSFHRDPFHSNPGNWVCGIIYFCKDDPRIIVPKRLRGFGGTLNFARPLALPMLLFLVSIAILPFEALRSLQIHSPAAYSIMKAAIATGVIWLCIRLSLPPRR